MITLLQLEYFLRLCASPHITQTAKELSISQTALSSMLISLEKELGVKLFDRENRSIKLNSMGKIYYKYVSEALCSLENGKRALQDWKNSNEGVVSIAVGSPLVWLPMLSEFRRTHPNATVRQSNWSLKKLYNGLRQSEFDFVIAGLDDLPADEFDHIEFRVDKLYLCVSNNSPLARLESISMSELQDLPFICVPEDTPWRKFCDEKLFAQAGFPCKVVLECDYALRPSLIESGYGVALTTGLAKDVDLLRPNSYIPISDSFAIRPMALFWGTNNYISSTALEFKDFCLQYFAQEKTSLP